MLCNACGRTYRAPPTAWRFRDIEPQFSREAVVATVSAAVQFQNLAHRVWPCKDLVDDFARHLGISIKLALDHRYQPIAVDADQVNISVPNWTLTYNNGKNRRYIVASRSCAGASLDRLSLALQHLLIRKVRLGRSHPTLGSVNFSKICLGMVTRLRAVSDCRAVISQLRSARNFQPVRERG